MTKQDVLDFAKQQIQAGKSFQETKEILLEQTQNESLSAEVLTIIKKELHQESFKKGIIKIGIAVVLLLFSFIYSCVNFHSNEPFAVVMYSFTICGTFLLLWGCYDIFN